VTIIGSVLSAFSISAFTSAGAGVGLAELLLLTILQVGLFFVILVLYVCAWIVTTHVVLLMSGGCAFTLRRTAQAILYGGGASIVNIIPCVGGIGGTVWWIVSAINMVSRGQRVSGKRASLAVLGAPILLTLCCFGGWVALTYTVVSRYTTP
jgi:hypothetical protein